MNQKEGVFAAVRSVFTEATVPQTGAWSATQKEQVHSILAAMFKQGEVDYKGGCPNDAALMKYIPGLVNNWVRKDTRLNGGEKYQTKNPGSRTGSGDEALRNMKVLLSVTTDPQTKQLIQAEIDKRTASLAAAKAPSIDPTKLPESLRHLVDAA